MTSLLIVLVSSIILLSFFFLKARKDRFNIVLLCLGIVAIVAVCFA